MYVQFIHNNAILCSFKNTKDTGNRVYEIIIIIFSDRFLYDKHLYVRKEKLREVKSGSKPQKP